MKKVYPCVLIPETIGGYSVIFPDVPGATQGEDLYEALTMAEDALGLMLTTAEDEGQSIPEPTPLNEVEVPENGFVTLVKADTDAYRKMLAAEE